MSTQSSKSRSASKEKPNDSSEETCLAEQNSEKITSFSEEREIKVVKEIDIDDYEEQFKDSELGKYREKIEKQLEDLRVRIGRNRKILEETRKKIESIDFKNEEKSVNEQNQESGDFKELDDHEDVMNMLKERMSELKVTANSSTKKDSTKFKDVLDTTLEQLNDLMNLKTKVVKSVDENN